MEPIQGNPCSLNRYASCNVCFCFDFHDFFSFCRVQWTGISLCILQLFYVPTKELEGLLWYPVIFTGFLQGRITTQGGPCNRYSEWVCSEQISKDIPIRYTVFAFKNSINELTFLRGIVARTKSFAIASLLSWTWKGGSVYMYIQGRRKV